MCLGIPGNIVCCLVFLLQGLRDRIHLLLFSLAVADLINVLSQFVPRLSCLIRWGWGDPLGAENWQVFHMTYLAHLSRWSSFVSGILIVVMSVDRCLSVTIPLKAARILTFRPMLVTIVATYFIPLACFVPNFLVFRAFWLVDPATNRSMARMALVDDVIPRVVPAQIVAVITVIIKPIAVIIVIFCCLITVVTLLRASRKRVQMQETQRVKGVGESRITPILLSLCVFYVILILPEACVALVSHFVPEFRVFGKYYNTFVVMYHVIFTASALNSSANFFAYLLLSTKFRSTLKNVCFCRSEQRGHQRKLTMVTSS